MTLPPPDPTQMPRSTGHRHVTPPDRPAVVGSLRANVRVAGSMPTMSAGPDDGPIEIEARHQRLPSRRRARQPESTPIARSLEAHA